jgi:acyl-CoA thioesterase I
MNDVKLLCIGDSLTFGYEMESSKRWTSLLEKELNIKVFNYGINGDTTTGMLGRLMSALKEVNPTHTLIFGGTNDLWFGLKNEFIISNIYAMTKQAIYENSIPVIGIPTPSFNINELNFVGDNYAESIKNFQDVLLNHCLEIDINYINFSKYMTKECYMDDGIHYNEKGHELMMKSAKEKMSNLIIL